MTGASSYLMLCSLLAVAFVWAIPRNQGLNAVAVLTLISVSALSPASGLWLLCTTLITVSTIRHYQAKKYRGVVVSFYSVILVTLLFISREMNSFFWVGGAYFTLRHLHVMIDWWMGRLTTPTVGQYFQYSFFLPVLMAGPIHRLDNFQRQIRRQRITIPNLFNGAERALFGLAQAVIISGWGLRRLRDTSTQTIENWPLFIQRWIEGSFDWLQMFFSFAGLTSLALGLSLMMGLKLEENFNRPWAAKNLIDFWSRWHMTLSNWCRDYVFYPMTAVTRLPIVGLLMAMLAMGLWHDNSAYYVLWAVWQSLGIYMTHVAVRLPNGLIPVQTRPFIGPLSVFLWLSLTKPMVLQFLDLFSS
jgi:D-alanyl-lipoteichoic acid acyltransferase DltB (MBOAT superfamily)